MVETGGLFVVGNHGGSDADYAARSGGDDIHHALGAADIETGMVVNLLRGDLLATVDIGRFVGHLGSRGEPALADRIDERTGRHEGRTGGPEAKAGVFHQSPVITVRVAIVRLGD